METEQEKIETPGGTGLDSTWLCLNVPKSTEWIGLFLGALWEQLTDEQNYQQRGETPTVVVDEVMNTFLTYVVTDSIGESSMIGEVRMWASNSIPDGWRKCDGSSLSRTVYAGLFAVIGTIWGEPDAESFSLPNFEDRAPTGANTLSGHPAGTAYGEASHMLTDQEISHRHSLPRGNNSSGANNVMVSPGAIAAATFTDYIGGTTRTAHNNIPPSLAIHFIIFVGEGE